MTQEKIQAGSVMQTSEMVESSEARQATKFMQTSPAILPCVAFVCVHNSCRSQMAEALGTYLAADTFMSYSAGTELAPRINQDAVRLMKSQYGIDMEEKQCPKLLSAIPPVDIVITMGCNVACPHLPCLYREDWGLQDPSGVLDKTPSGVVDKTPSGVLDKAPSGVLDKEKWENRDQAFLYTIERIHARILDLQERIRDKRIPLSQTKA